jgi:hypothetical protein
MSDWRRSTRSPPPPAATPDSPLPQTYRQRAIGYLVAGRRDLVLNQEQLLVAMRLVIEHGLGAADPILAPRPAAAQFQVGVARDSRTIGE